MSTSTKALIGALIAGAVGIVIFFFVQFGGKGGTDVKLGPTVARACASNGECLPDVNLVDTNGTAYTPKDLAGKVVVLNYWATWCGPCEKEIPDLSRIARQYEKEGLLVLGVLTNDSVDSQALLNFQSDHDMTYPVVRKPGSLSAPRNLPTTMVYDRKGNMVPFPNTRTGAYEGGIKPEQFTDFLLPLLAAK